MADAADLLFELGTEELPPVALKKLSDALTGEFVAGLESANLSHGEVISYATPRRLAVLVRALQTRQPDREMERRGPAVKAAFDAEGNPTKAAQGFARSCGTTVEQLDRLATDKGEWLVYQIHEEGKTAGELLPGIAENALNRLPIPKRMRWGSSEVQFVRPVHWLLFLHGERVVDCTILDARADRLTHGHRFHHPQAIRIDTPDTYQSILEEKGKVIAHFQNRASHIKNLVEGAAKGLGGVAGLDDALLEEVTALNEWPVAVTGSFEKRFLEVPHEALVTTMKTNQKYFPVFDANGGLMNHFITIANVESRDPDMIRAGNERVVRPRLADAMFFWEQDGKKTLEDHIESLKGVVFEKQLGSMYDKSQRVAALAGEIAAAIGGDVGLAMRAGLLSRCDLMTEMVYEFASMQGIMGRYQAGRDGEDPEVAQSMDEFYMPRFSGDRLPQTRTGIAIALAERIDTLVGIFGIGMKPTGDKDPYALRRAALGALRILSEHSLTLNIRNLLDFAALQLDDRIKSDDTVDAVEHFMFERLRGLYADRSFSGDLFDAVAAVRPHDLNDFEKRMLAVSAFRELPEAEALSAANKRIGNILKKVEGKVPDTIDPARFELDAERTLYAQLEQLSGTIAGMAEKADYADILKALSGLRDTVDTFFDDVMVMAEDPAVRDNRLALLRNLQSLFLRVADVSVLQAPGND